uniref:Uncharacterized protein n=1 Tax=Crocodylus porosus TaxID=8502 RepID=A0A7M4EX14_CROPO
GRTGGTCWARCGIFHRPCLLYNSPPFYCHGSSLGCLLQRMGKSSESYGLYIFVLLKEYLKNFSSNQVNPWRISLPGWKCFWAAIKLT